MRGLLVSVIEAIAILSGILYVGFTPYSTAWKWITSLTFLWAMGYVVVAVVQAKIYKGISNNIGDKVLGKLVEILKNSTGQDVVVTHGEGEKPNYSYGTADISRGKKYATFVNENIIEIIDNIEGIKGDETHKKFLLRSYKSLTILNEVSGIGVRKTGHMSDVSKEQTQEELERLLRGLRRIERRGN